MGWFGRKGRGKGIVLVLMIRAEGSREVGVLEMVMALPLGERIVDARKMAVMLGVNVRLMRLSLNSRVGCI